VKYRVAPDGLLDANVDRQADDVDLQLQLVPQPRHLQAAPQTIGCCVHERCTSDSRMSVQVSQCRAVRVGNAQTNATRQHVANVAEPQSMHEQRELSS